MKILSSIAFSLCLARCLGSASATSYSVELTGNDSNSGLVGSPWRTLAKACETVTADEGHVIQIGEGTFTEAEILTLKSGVSLIGAGSGKTKILVNHHFSLTDAVPNANPHVNTFPEHFVLQLNGSNQVVKGFSLDGQDKRCHGGIFAPWTRDVVFEDLHVTHFRYCGLWVIEAHETILRFSRFKNNTYGNPKGAGEGGGDSGAVQYHRGTNLTIHDNHIEETGNLRPDFGGYAMKAQDRNYSVSEANVLAGLKVYNNTLIVPTSGAWENGTAPAISAEFLGMALKDCEIHHNIINNHVSLAGTASLGSGIRIHHNFFNLGWGRYAYGVESMMDNLDIHHNHFFGGIYPIALWGKHPKNHNIHHNLFEGACAGGFVNRELLQYKAPVTNLRFINNTIIDSGGIGRIFALHESSTYEAHNNLIVRTLEPKDIWGTEIPGKVSHNFISNVTPHGENAISGDPGITLAEGRPLRPPYYTIKPDSPILNQGETISPLTDGFTGSAPDIGAIENGVALNIPLAAGRSWREKPGCDHVDGREKHHAGSLQRKLGNRRVPLGAIHCGRSVDRAVVHGDRRPAPLDPRKGPHGKGSIIGALRQSFHHNLWAHQMDRSPKISWRRFCEVDSRNNVMFNWGEASCHDASHSHANWVGNYYKPGPATYDGVRSCIFTIQNIPAEGVKEDALLYIEGNHVEGFPEISADNWAGGVLFSDGTGLKNRARQPFPFPRISCETSAIDAYPRIPQTETPTAMATVTPTWRNT